jgi:hypothetical protein
MKKREKTRCDDWEPWILRIMDMIDLSHVEYGGISQEKVVYHRVIGAGGSSVVA